MYNSNARKIVAFERDPADPRKPIPVEASRNKPVIRDQSKRPDKGMGVLSRFYVGSPSHPTHRILSDAAPEILSILKAGALASSSEEYRSHEDAFSDAANAFMEDFKRGRRQGRADADMYSLLAAVAQTQMLVESAHQNPTLPNLLPITDLGTVKETGVYLKTTYSDPGVSHSWEWGTDDSPVSTIKIESVPIKLLPIKAPVVISGRDQELHDEIRGTYGAIDWDLVSKSTQLAMRQIMIAEGDTVAYGHQGIPGLLLPSGAGSITSQVNVNYAQGTGLTDYSTIAAQWNLQRGQVKDHEDYVADTLILDPETWRLFTTELLSNTGDSTQSVLSALFANIPDLVRVAYAREFAPDADEIAAKTPKVGAAKATALGGGILKGGTHRRCALITRSGDPTIHTVIRGFSPSVEALENRDGAQRAQIRMSSGGCVIGRPDVPRLLHIGA